MKREGDKLYFSSGRQWEPHNGIIGIDPKGAVFEGYDASLTGDWQEEADQLTTVERCDLASFMIEEWTRFAVTPPTPGEPR